MRGYWLEKAEDKRVGEGGTTGVGVNSSLDTLAKVSRDTFDTFAPAAPNVDQLVKKVEVSPNLDVEHDPRPDITADHGLWEGVLGLAKAEFPRRIGVYQRDEEGRWGGTWVTLYTLLHGLRCAGARLEVRESGTLRLDYRPALPELAYTEEELRRYWLDPARRRLAECFARAREIGERRAG